jgi:hypothetical protein
MAVAVGLVITIAAFWAAVDRHVVIVRLIDAPPTRLVRSIEVRQEQDGARFWKCTFTVTYSPYLIRSLVRFRGSKLI